MCRQFDTLKRLIALVSDTRLRIMRKKLFISLSQSILISRFVEE